MILGMIITALSAFTDATRNLLDLVVSEKRPAINGEWVAELTYPSRSTKYSEASIFSGNETGLQGTASYLEKEQIIVDGTVIDNQIEFKTKTMEYSPDWNNDQRKMATHQYRGTVSANGIEFVMETHGGFSTDPPLKFIAKKGAGK